MPAGVWNGSWLPIKGLWAWNGSWTNASSGKIRNGSWVDFLVKITLTNQDVTDVENFGSAIAMYEINADGFVYSNVAPTTREQWCDPATAAGNYEVRATLTFGETPGGDVLDTWLPLTTSRRWTVTASNLDPDSESNLTVEVRGVGSSSVLASATVNLTASYIPFE